MKHYIIHLQEADGHIKDIIQKVASGHSVTITDDHGKKYSISMVKEKWHPRDKMHQGLYDLGHSYESQLPEYSW